MAQGELVTTSVVERTGKKQSAGELEAGNAPSHSSRIHSGSNKNALERYINLTPAVAFGLTILSTWPSLSLTLQAGLYNGGPTALVWGMLMATIGSSCIAAVLGEMASITPQVGAQYRWTGLYAPRGTNPAFWSLLQGWLTIFAWICLCAAWPFITALLIQGLITLNNPETYVPERWHATLLMWALLSVPVLCNIFARRILVVLEIIGGVLHIAFFFCIIVTLLVLSPRSTDKFVFTSNVFGLSGWDSHFVQWCLGLITSTSIMTGFDGSLHLSDEIKDAPKKVPQSMMASILTNGVVGFVFIIVVLYCIGDLERVTTTTTGFPIIEIFYQSTGSVSWATGLTSMIVIPAMICQFGVFASVSRLVWAFAVDKGLPFSNFFARVHPTLKIPVNSLILITIICMLIGLINIGSTSAFYAIISLGSLALYSSYLLPVLFFLWQKLRGPPIRYGPFRLGWASLPINIYAAVWIVFVMIWIPFPQTLPVTVQGMNYSSAVMVFVILLGLADWFIGGRKRFVVPTKVEETPYDE